MKIALVTDAWFPQVNGVVRTWSQVGDELEAMGHEMFVIRPEQFKTFPCPRYPDIRLSWFPRRKVARMLDEAKPDIIHIPTEGPLGLVGRAYCLKRKLPFTTSYHTQYAQYVKKYLGIPQPITYRMLRWFHGAADRILVPTPTIVRELEERGFRNLVVWTRGVDTELFRPYGKDLYRDLQRPVFSYIGRVSIEKNLDAFLSADLPGSKVIVGDGPALPSLRKRYPDAVFVGFKHGEELARHFAAADVFVFPSLTDTFGVVLLESMACGVPVAAYPVAGPIDVVENGTVGVLDEDLAKAALAALDLDPDRCRAYASEFSWRRVAEIFLESSTPAEPAAQATGAGGGSGVG
ncbi:MAG: glycosyltransferase family 1 protein [Planctomycetota bacterium]|nr:glycosyltransferase family 1 protein [Planctomycetota bacterium]